MTAGVVAERAQEEGLALEEEPVPEAAGLARVVVQEQAARDSLALSHQQQSSSSKDCLPHQPLSLDTDKR